MNGNGDAGLAQGTSESKTPAAQASFAGGVLRVFAGNAGSKVLGLCRVLLLASLFGTGMIADSFARSLAIMLVLTNFVGSEFLRAALIPVMQSYMTEHPARARRLFRTLLGILLSIAVPLALLLGAFSAQVVAVVGPGLKPEAAAMAAGMLRIFALAAPLNVMIALFTCTEMCARSYMLVSARPMLENAFLIVGICLAKWVHPYMLPVCYVTFFVLFCSWAGRRALAALPPKGDEAPDELTTMSLIQPVLLQFAPLAVVALVVQARLYVNQVVASHIDPGAFAATDYAIFIGETPMMLIMIPLYTVALAHYSGADWRQIRGQIAKLDELVLLAIVPLSLFVFLDSKLIVQVAYERGSFRGASTDLVAGALKGLSIGFWAQGSAMLIQRLYSAQQQNRRLVLPSLLSLGVAVALSFALYKPLGLFGLGLAGSASRILLFVMLYWQVNILSPVIRRLVLVGTIGIPYALLLVVLRIPNSLLCLAAHVAVSGAYWAGAYWIVPSLRADLQLLLAKVRKTAGAD